MSHHHTGQLLQDPLIPITEHTGIFETMLASRDRVPPMEVGRETRHFANTAAY